MRVFILFFLSLLSFTSIAQQINFEVGSLEQILEKAKQENKLIFVDLYADWCGPCKIMEATTFNQSEVAEEYNNAFVNYKVNIDEPIGKQVKAKYNVFAYPTYLFLSPSGEVLYRLEGVFKPAEMIEEAEFALGLLK